MMNRSGYMLLEAVLTVVIVSICLTFMTQSLLTNFRAGVRFQETVRSLIVMENMLGLLYATNASEGDFDPGPRPMESPYDKFTLAIRTDGMAGHLKKAGLTLGWPAGQKQGRLDVTTFIYIPDET